MQTELGQFSLSFRPPFSLFHPCRETIQGGRMTWVDLKANSEEMVRTTQKKYGERTEKKVKSMRLRKTFQIIFYIARFRFISRIVYSLLFFIPPILFHSFLSLLLVSMIYISEKETILWERLIISENNLSYILFFIVGLMMELWMLWNWINLDLKQARIRISWISWWMEK